MATVDGSGVVRAIAPGTAQIQASVGGASGSAAVQVLEAPRIVLSRSEVSFAATAGGVGTEAVQVEITNGGGGSLTGLDVSVAWVEGESGWLTAELSSGTAPTVLRLRTVSAGFAAGRYEAQVTVRASGPVPIPSATLEAELLVSEGAPAIRVSPEAVGFSSSEGQGVPSPQSVGVTNAGGGELTGLAAQVEYVGGGMSGWLTATLEASTAPTDLILQVDPSGLEPRIYDAQVRVTSPEAAGQGAVVQVRYSFGEPPPRFHILPSSVSLSVEEGDAPTDATAVGINNEGSGELGQITASIEYSGATEGWIQSQLVGTTAPTSLLVTFVPEALLPGDYEAAALIESPDATNSPASVSLSLRVLSRPLPDASTIVASPDSILADGASNATVTVSLRDARGNLVGRGGDDVALSTSAGTLSSLADLGEGRYRATLTASTDVETAVLTGLLRGEPISDSAAVHFVPDPEPDPDPEPEPEPEPDATQSSVGADPTSMTTEDSSTITVQLRDSDGNDLTTGGDDVFLETSLGELDPAFGTTNTNGRFTSTLTAASEGTATITGYLGTGNTGPQIGTATVTIEEVEPDPEPDPEPEPEPEPDATQSSVEADPTSMTTEESSTITVQLRDSGGNDLTTGGDEVFLETSLGELDPAFGTTDTNGRFTSTLTAGSKGTATITAYLGTSITDPQIGTATVTIEEVEPDPEPEPEPEPDATQSSVEADPTSITTEESSTITVQLRDSGGNDLTTGGDEVFLLTSLGSLTPRRGTTDSNGQFVSRLESSSTGTADVRVHLGFNASGPVIGTATVEVTEDDDGDP